MKRRAFLKGLATAVALAMGRIYPSLPGPALAKAWPTTGTEWEFAFGRRSWPHGRHYDVVIMDDIVEGGTVEAVNIDRLLAEMEARGDIKRILQNIEIPPETPLEVLLRRHRHASPQ